MSLLTGAIDAISEAVSRAAVTIPALEMSGDNDLDALRATVQALREGYEILTGQRGDPLDTVLTRRDFLDGGFKIDATLGFPYAGNVGIVLPGGGTIPSIPETIEDDYTTPPRLVNVEAVAALTTILLTWDDPHYTNWGAVEVWRASTDDLGAAIRVGTTTANIYLDPIGLTGTGFYYWVRIVSRVDIEGPFQDVAGAFAQTGLVDGTDLSDAIITAEKLADGSVGAGAIIDGAVVAGKLAANSIIAGDGVIANAAIGAAQIGSVSADTITSGFLAAARILAGSLSADKITANSITTAQIQAGGIHGDRIQARTIAADRIAANAITAAEIAANTLTSDQIAAGSITADRILVSAANQASVTPDPGFEDVTNWTGFGVERSTPVNWARYGKYVVYGTADDAQWYSKPRPLDATKVYRASLYLDASTGCTRICYPTVIFYDKDGSVINGSSQPVGWPSAGTYHYFGGSLIGGTPPENTWTEASIVFGAGQAAGIPTGAVAFSIGAILHYSYLTPGRVGTVYMSGARIQEATDAGKLIVDGTIVTNKIQVGAVSAPFTLLLGVPGTTINSAATYIDQTFSVGAFNSNGGRLICSGYVQFEATFGSGALPEFVIGQVMPLIDGSFVDSFLARSFIAPLVVWTAGGVKYVRVVVPASFSMSGLAVGSRTFQVRLAMGFYRAGSTSQVAAGSGASFQASVAMGFVEVRV